MSTKVKREKTKYPNIYFNHSTGKYDVKYNYKIYITRCFPIVVNMGILKKHYIL